jgi:NADH:ubiquinone oxidoreductase subunit B-like Fe-S oxidoreductase
LFGGSGLPGSEIAESDAVDAFDSWRVLASEVVELLAVRLSRSLWNLRFVVASAGCCSVEVMFPEWKESVMTG